VLAELAAANAAFAVIKETLNNGRELYEAGEAIADYFGVKSELQKKAHEHGYKSDLQAFLALEQLKVYEDELKQMMVWQGRGGLWEEWLRFQAQMKESREEVKRIEDGKKAKRKKLIVDWSIGIVMVVCILSAVGFAAYILYWLVKTKGR